MKLIDISGIKSIAINAPETELCIDWGAMKGNTSGIMKVKAEDILEAIEDDVYSESEFNEYACVVLWRDYVKYEDAKNVK